MDKDNYDIKLNLHIYENMVTISLDSSGDSLHKRNYRKNNGQAPLNEVTAAGLIQLSGWQKDCNFFDPMCGSGTLLIEAAMYAYNIPAQYYRKRFAFKKWSDFSLPEWKRVQEEENKKKLVKAGAVILAVITIAGSVLIIFKTNNITWKINITIK